MSDTQLILCSGTVLLFLFAVGCLWLHARIRRVQARLYAAEQEVASLKSSAIGMGQRILALEKTGARPAVGGEDAPVAARSYSEATHLLEMGVSRDEVASRCGLSRAEASLLDALRKKPAS